RRTLERIALCWNKTEFPLLKASQKLGLFRRKFRLRKDVLPAQLRQTFDGLQNVLRRQGRGRRRGGRCGGPGRILRRRRRLISSLVALGFDQWQVGDAYEAELAGEGQRPVAALLLGEAGEPVVAGVVHADPAVLLDRETTRAWEEGVSHVILGAGRGGAAEFRRPPRAV